MLDAAGLGSSAASGEGFELASGANQLTTIPWTNINQISIAFSEFVNVSQSSLTLYNSANTTVPISGFSYNGTANIATWQFATPLVAGKYVMNLAGTSVTDSNNTELDGAWTTGVSTFAAGSGDGSPGSDFNFYFDVLPGDANSSGTVTNGDVLITKLQVGAVSNSSNYLDDVNASGNITNGDVLLEKLQVGSNINTFASPQLPPQSAPAAAPATVNSDDSSGGSVVMISPAAGFIVPTLVPVAIVPSADDDGPSVAISSSGDGSTADDPDANSAAPIPQPAPAALVLSMTISPALSAPTAPTSTSLLPLVPPTSAIVVLTSPLTMPTAPLPTESALAASPVADLLFQSLAESTVSASPTVPTAPTLEPSDALALAFGSLVPTPSLAAFTPIDDVADNAAPTSLPAALTSTYPTPASPMALDQVFATGSGSPAAEFSAVDFALTRRTARLVMAQSQRWL
jgi:methionine-rich copper-binding protein CopC